MVLLKSSASCAHGSCFACSARPWQYADGIMAMRFGNGLQVMQRLQSKPAAGASLVSQPPRCRSQPACCGPS